jgi:hypothetical protein
MLIFGSRTKGVWSGQEPTDVPCDSCSRLELRPHVFQRYAHVFWIPMFPTGKKVFFECTHCKRTLAPKEGPSTLAPFAKAAKAAAKTPLYLFVGLAALAVLVGFAAVQGRNESRNTEAWAAAPAVGDLYILDVTKVFPEMEKESFNFVVARVNKVTADEVEVQFGAYGYLVFGGAERAIDKDEIDKKDYFTPDNVALERSKLVTWQANHGLRAVIRE